MPTVWENIVKTALIGTERHPLSAADLATLGLPVTATDPAQAALEALAAAHLRRKTGFVLADAPAERPLPAPHDHRPICGSAAIALLRQMLSGRHRPALPEFLELLTASNQRLPPELLPDLLPIGLDNKFFFKQLEPALGPLGKWLAQQHFRWRNLLTDAEEDWFTASFDERRRLLLTARQRKPLVALAWLEATWNQEKSEHKTKFLEIFACHLSLNDDALLQKAISDKSESVRLVAHRLLDLLPLTLATQLQVAIAAKPEDLPKPVQRELWPEQARFALLSLSLFKAKMLADVWPTVLERAVQYDFPMLSNYFEQVAKPLAYQGDYLLLESILAKQLQLQPTTRNVFADILDFRRQISMAFK